MKIAPWQTTLLASALVAGWAGAAAAQPVSIVAYAAEDPPVPAGQVEAAVVAVARADGFEPEADPLTGPAGQLLAGAVPSERLEAFVEARRLVERGWSAYLAVEVDFAASQLANARRVAAGALDLEGGVELYADISLRLGVVLDQLQRPAAAVDAYRLARALDRTRVVTMAEFSPDVVAAFEAAISEVPERVRVTIAVDPAGAVIELDGAALGAGPVTVELDVGHHIVVARAEGRRARGELIAITANTSSVALALDVDPIAAALLAAGAELTVGATETRSQLAIDGLVLYGELDGVALVASVWRRGAPALLGQWCEGVPATCTRVVEIGYAEAGAVQSAARNLWQALQEARTKRAFPPTLLEDARLTRGESRPGATPNGDTTTCRWCRSPWVWVGVGAAAMAAGGVYLLTRESDSMPVITLDPCRFGRCP